MKNISFLITILITTFITEGAGLHMSLGQQDNLHVEGKNVVFIDDVLFK